ncbi:zinc knuckle [Emericellopsis cladophorae]|uniref:Zinc knuckle n=1 Tax=Emericellopsis cladophorae TaxID=2686198 RepID=A0A9P9XV65_9HYPO|nr:zinc knuckle [Emericellopsis cladophorae]KAI6778330.1 zinc knuckle [Emericellopsis cladophorae]
MAKVKAAYKARPKYHPEAPVPPVSAAGGEQIRIKETTRSRRPALEPRQSKEREKAAYNVRKSKDTVMATLFRDPRIREYDIIAVQEP